LVDKYEVLETKVVLIDKDKEISMDEALTYTPSEPQGVFESLEDYRKRSEKKIEAFKKTKHTKVEYAQHVKEVNRIRDAIQKYPTEWEMHQGDPILARKFKSLQNLPRYRLTNEEIPWENTGFKIFDPKYPNASLYTFDLPENKTGFGITSVWDKNGKGRKYNYTSGKNGIPLKVSGESVWYGARKDIAAAERELRNFVASKGLDTYNHKSFKTESFDRKYRQMVDRIAKKYNLTSAKPRGRRMKDLGLGLYDSDVYK